MVTWLQQYFSTCFRTFQNMSQKCEQFSCGIFGGIFLGFLVPLVVPLSFKSSFSPVPYASKYRNHETSSVVWPSAVWTLLKNKHKRTTFWNVQFSKNVFVQHNNNFRKTKGFPTNVFLCFEHWVFGLTINNVNALRKNLRRSSLNILKMVLLCFSL